MISERYRCRPLIAAGVLLGIGMGGFCEGILLHQILQLHSMVSNHLPPNTVISLRVNIFWDGLFLSCSWLSTVMGVICLWRVETMVRVPHSTPVLLGAIMTGWGSFMLAEGLINHHFLQLHHVIERSAYPEKFWWDMAFLAFGLLLCLMGGWLIHEAKLRLR